MEQETRSTEAEISATSELHAVRRELEQLNSHRFIRMHNSLPRLIGFNLLRGLAFGLGTVLGASVLLSVLAWFIAQIEFLPIISEFLPTLGEWAAEIARQMKEAR